MRLWLVALDVFVVNLPFGYWRARVPTRPPQWCLAIHLPAHALIGAFFPGQFVGCKLTEIRTKS